MSAARMARERETAAGVAALAGLLLSACTVGPTYTAPDVTAPPAFRNAADPATPAPAALDGAAWWSGFGDPVLDSLIEEAVAANLDIRQAAARVRQARAQVRLAEARARPAVSASAQGSKTRLSKTSSIAEIAKALPTGGAIGLPGSDVTAYQAGLDAAWDLDLFGADARGIEAATAREGAAEWTTRDVRVSLGAEIARNYFEHGLAQARLTLADRRRAEQADGVETTVVRVRNGLATTVDQRRAEQRLAAVDAARAALAADREGRLQALAVLLGEPAAALAPRLAAAAPDAAAPPVPAGLPSDLLRRRPDVRAAERRLAAAVADIGAARADLYPKLTLTGGVDLASSALGSLFSVDSLQPTAAARLVFPLLDGGARRTTVALREAQRDEAYAAYQGVVLAALRDVEIALSRLSADRARLTRLAAAEAASHDVADTAGVQNRAGLTGALDLIAAWDDWLSAQDARVQAQAQVRLDIVALDKALGGGWTDDDRSDR